MHEFTGIIPNANFQGDLQDLEEFCAGIDSINTRGFGPFRVRVTGKPKVNRIYGSWWRWLLRKPKLWEVTIPLEYVPESEN